MEIMGHVFWFVFFEIKLSGKTNGGSQNQFWWQMPFLFFFVSRAIYKNNSVIGNQF
jgi:hypothetical protein